MVENVNSFLLYGDNLEYILFKNAINFAENGGKIWFISPEAFKELPSGITIIDKNVLKNITFLYLKEISELSKQLNGIHTWYRIPELIILNNFHSYRDNIAITPIQCAYLCASLLDACKACSKKLLKNTHLIVAYNNEPSDDDLLQNIVNLYFDHVINANELPSSCIIPNITN